MNLPIRAPHGTPVNPSIATKPGFTVRLTDIAALRADGSTVLGQRKIPGLPIFERAFSAFSQGTVFKAKSGFLAVEDLQPGDWLETTTGDVEQVTWIGACSFAPTDRDGAVPLTRVMADSFGVSRPDTITGFGPAARLLKSPANLRGSTLSDRMMTPARRFMDGVNVVEVVPPTPLRLFHVATRRHTALIANGLPVESYHPGENPITHLSHTLRTAFLGLFPNVDKLSDFGPVTFTHAPDN